MNDLDGASDPSSQAEAHQNEGKPHLAGSMCSFSNFAISLSTICILAGGVNLLGLITVLTKRSGSASATPLAHVNTGGLGGMG